MFRYSSQELKGAIDQLAHGLITETEFLASMQLIPETMEKLMKYNADELTLQSANVGTLDDFNEWRAPITNMDFGDIPAPPTEVIVDMSAPVLISLKYKNHTLAAIMLGLKEVLPSEAFESIKLIEDTLEKWAIHTDEAYYFSVDGVVRRVTDLKYRSADTGNPDWDLFCSI